MVRFACNRKGFTLIELMIAVAIIGILAAIAIPQFARYRMRAFNAAAESDVRNLKTSEEVLMHDAQIYGSSEQSALPGSGGAGGGHAQGAIVNGPMPAGSEQVSGALVSGTSVDGAKHGVGLAVSNSVELRADTMEADASFTAYAHHLQGHRVFAVEAESTAIWICENAKWIGKTVESALAIPAITTGGDLQGQPCNGAAISKWTAL